MKPVRLWFVKLPTTHEEFTWRVFVAAKHVAKAFVLWVKPSALGASQPHSKTWGR